jgi:uncharacterized protein with GYD domain
MAKFNVSVTKVTTVVYDSVEIDAEDDTTAQRMAVEMAEDGDISEETNNEEYQSTVSIVPELAP